MLLILGRTGAGKDTLAAGLKKRGLTGIKSYTTRPKRTPDEDTHIFITKKEADVIKDKAAWTCINGHEYFCTREQIRDADWYIIDPKGAYTLFSTMPDEEFDIMYIYAPKKERMEHGISRALDTEKEKEVFNAREKNENDQFTEFEDRLQAPDPWFLKHTDILMETVNDYSKGWLDHNVKQILKHYKPVHHE